VKACESSITNQSRLLDRKPFAGLPLYFFMLTIMVASCGTASIDDFIRTSPSCVPILPSENYHASLSITYYGTACFVLEYAGTRILTDPGDFFTNRLTRAKASTIEDINLVIVTHADFDHVNRLAGIPGIETIMIFGTESVKREFPLLTVDTNPEIEIHGARVRRIRANHALRPAVDHTAYLITFPGTSILFCGDASELGETPGSSPDFTFVTICGSEANPQNAVKIVKDTDTRCAIPMHWEVFFRDMSLVREFIRLLDSLNKTDEGRRRCFVPQYDTTIMIDPDNPMRAFIPKPGKDD
jgi:L-ascorbate metabolism protein UlaG (beta-lactamase superfamily)